MAKKRANGEVDPVSYKFTINFANPLEMTFDDTKLSTRFADGKFPDVNIASAINMESYLGVKLVTGGVTQNNNWGIVAGAIKYTYELIDDFGGAIELTEQGVLSYSGTGFNVDPPVNVRVRVTADVPGIVIFTEEATVKIEAPL